MKLNLSSGKNQKTIIIVALICMLSGVLIMTMFFLQLSHNYSILGKKILLTESSEVGGFIGGVVGSLWSLCGILLFYAALRLQTNELIENRNSYKQQRTTDIVYSQLENYNKQIDGFKINFSSLKENPNYVARTNFNQIENGRIALVTVQIELKNLNEFISKDSFERIEDSKTVTSFLEDNLSNILVFLNGIKLQILVVKEVIDTTNLEETKKNELEKLFVTNIARDIHESIRSLANFFKQHVSWLESIGQNVAYEKTQIITVAVDLIKYLEYDARIEYDLSKIKLNKSS